MKKNNKRWTNVGKIEMLLVVMVLMLVICFFVGSASFILPRTNTSKLMVEEINEKQITLEFISFVDIFKLNGFQTKFNDGKLYISPVGGIFPLPIFWFNGWSIDEKGRYVHKNDFGEIKEVYQSDGYPEDNKLLWSDGQIVEETLPESTDSALEFEN